MTNFIEQAEFAQTIPKLKRGSGFKGLEQRLNQLLQPLVNRTRFLGEQNTGGGGLVFGGEWDMSSGELITSNAQPSVARSTLFEKIDATQYRYISDANPYPIQGGVYLDGVACEGKTALDSGVRSMWCAWPEHDPLSDNFAALNLVVHDNTVEFSDLALLFNAQMPVHPVHCVSVTMTDFNNGTTRLDFYSVSNNTVLYAANSTITTPVFGTDIFLSVDTTTGATVLTVGTTDYPFATGLNIGALPSSYLANSFGVTVVTNAALNTATKPVFNLGTELEGRSPFLSENITEVELPIDAADGTTYLVVNAGGIYLDNAETLVGDFVTLYADKTKLIITRLVTDAEIQEIVSATVNGLNLGIVDYTIADLPLASAASGVAARITDLGSGNAQFYSDGTYWLPVGEQLLKVSNVSTVLTTITSETVLATFSFPAKLASPNMTIVISSFWEASGAANSKYPKIRLDGIAGTEYLSTTLTTSYKSYQTDTLIRHRNSVSSQIGMSSGSLNQYGGATVPAVTSSVDMSASDVDIVLAGRILDGADSLSLSAYTISLRG